MSELSPLEDAAGDIVTDGRPSMSRARFVPLDATLLRLVVPRRQDLAQLAWLAQPSLVRAATAPGLGWVMIEGGYVLGAGGVVPCWEGRVTAWLLPSVHARPRHLALALPFIARWLDAVQAHPICHRVEATVPFTFGAGHRFARRLGFQREGLMRDYGPDRQSHDLYARIAGDKDVRHLRSVV